MGEAVVEQPWHVCHSPPSFSPLSLYVCAIMVCGVLYPLSLPSLYYSLVWHGMEDK